MARGKPSLGVATQSRRCRQFV